MKSPKTFQLFRKVALAEGVSFLLLLFIAMPLKYFASIPVAVTITGGLHGLLFVAFIVLAWETKSQYKQSWTWLAKGFVASVLPFGTFVMEKQWKQQQAAATGTAE